MAKLLLKFQERVLREMVPTGNIITIGRQPDNVLCIDNPAVSGITLRFIGKRTVMWLRTWIASTEHT